MLALARFLCAVGALDAGGAFGGMGASREMTVGLLVEPAMMMAVFSVAVAGGTTELGSWPRGAETLAALSWQASDLLALFAMLVLVLAETGRIPVDNPDTHLELTMLHEGMLLEHSGPGLACMMLATHTKQIVVLTWWRRCSFRSAWREGICAVEIVLAAGSSRPSCSRWRPFWGWSSRPTPSCGSSGCRSSSGSAWCAPSWRWR